MALVDAAAAAEILSLLNRAVAVLDTLPARLAAELRPERRSGGALAERDQRFLYLALPLLAGVVRDFVWSLGDIAADHPREFAELVRLDDLGRKPRHDGPASDKALAQRLGKTLARSAGVDVRGYRLERVGVQRSAALWRVVRVV